jgi:transcriptional regulator with GAF, ATPase, and Fis domain
MEQIIQLIRLIAARRCTVLVSGETGTGKEMAARAIHMASDRSQRPMVAVNCSAIPENLIEAELFGHVKGAFTGAINHRIGRFEQAIGGTLFLDEIADLPFDLQAKLLRVLQEREIQRLGSSEIVKIDVRIVAATNANLLGRVQQGRFREDLYYRLNVVPIHMPALRERMSDIPLLVNHFVRKICEAENLRVKEVSPDASRFLSAYSWPAARERRGTRRGVKWRHPLSSFRRFCAATGPAGRAAKRHQRPGRPASRRRPGLCRNPARI